MKKRLPRKLKKAMKTAQRLFDKSLGFKCRRAVMIPFMRQRYLTKQYGIRCEYNSNITLDELKIMTKLEQLIKNRTDIFPII